MVLDGVYRRSDGEPVFVEAPAPTDEDLQGLLHRIITRLMKLLTRRGLHFNLWFNPRSPRAQDMKKRVDAKGSLFTFEVYMAYSNVRLYADALQRAATADKKKVIAAPESSTWSDHILPYGPTKFVNGQNQGGRGTLQQASRTDIDVVWPNEFASTKQVFPRPKLG